jgi:hypothetical protein
MSSARTDLVSHISPKNDNSSENYHFELKMLRIIHYVRKQRAYYKDFAKALQLVDNGRKSEAFHKFESMLAEHPADPYLRNQILFLGRELHLNVHLPTMSPSKHASD